MNQTDLAWAAGIIDGEGCILLYHGKSSKNASYVLRVLVVNTSPLMIRRLREIFDDGCIHARRPSSAKHRPTWTWEVSARRAERVLRLIEPYLVNKRDEAAIGLASRELMGQHGRNQPNPNIEQLEWLKVRLSELKHIDQKEQP